MVVEGFDWGPGVSKVILNMEETVKEVEPGQFAVFARRTSDCVEITGPAGAGQRTILTAYVSDDRGARLDSGMYVTLVLQVSPMIPLSGVLVSWENRVRRSPLI